MAKGNPNLDASWLVALCLAVAVGGAITGCGESSCEADGRTYAEGTHWTCSDGCNSCFCGDGTITSTAIGCPTPPGYQ